jgi:hypothetical protein
LQLVRGLGCSSNDLVPKSIPVVEGSQAKILRYLAPDECKIRSGEAHLTSGESTAFFKFKVKVDENRQI